MTGFGMVARVLALVGLLVTLAACVSVIFFFGGFYSVAATQQDPAIVEWALVHVREASIGRHATDRPSGPLDDVALIRAGARAYSQRGCTSCHGGPGIAPARFSDGLNPPPNLKKVVNDLSPRELFWIVENGIKMTGMPSFRDSNPPLSNQEAWNIVGFLKKMSTVSETDFRAWTAGPPG